MVNIEELKSIIEGDISNDEETLEIYSEDKSIFKIKPRVVVFPKNKDDIKKLVNFARKYKISLTPRSAGTDMSGGAITDEILVVFTKYLNHFEINKEEKKAIVEPGLYFRDLERELNNYNLMFPVYPASKEICALGGMVANNCGGEKTLKYGKIDEHVLGLKVVLSDGNEYEIRKLNYHELEKKLSLDNFEGEIYRKVFKLIKDNFEKIKKKQPLVKKNSAGYNIWKIYDGESFDLTKLFVGSQGTLGIITEIELKLFEKLKYSKLIVAFLNDLNLIPEFLKRILPLQPVSLEITDDHTFKIYLKFARQMAEVLGIKGIFSTIKLFLPEFILILRSGIPKLIILIEFESNDEEEIFSKIEEFKKVFRNIRLNYRICESELENQKYWKLRRDTYKLLREKIKDKLAAPFIDDIIVNPENFPEFFPRLTKILNEAKIIYTISGHLGDGNLHIIPLLDMKKEKDKIFPLMEKVYDLVLDYNGSFTAEHNDGLIRGYYLKKLFGEEIYNIFLEIKRIFDPDNIFNKGKKIEVDLSYVQKHLKI